jgi:hypothetical protein
MDEFTNMDEQRAHLELIVNKQSALRSELDETYAQDLLEQSEAAAELRAMKNLMSAIVERCMEGGYVHQPAFARVPVESRGQRHLRPL